MTNDPDLWRRAKQVLQAALARPAVERSAFVADACGGDTGLRAEVESLLAAHQAAGQFGERPAIERLTRAGSEGQPDDGRMLRQGERLGPYVIGECLGVGGMGEVYKAVDTRLDRTVAIKVLPDVFRGDAGLSKRFEREAKAIAALHHPHICVLHDVGEANGLAYLVMEYLGGESLAHRLARGPLPLDAVLRVGVDIAEALAETHRHGIVHRDLKPANVMLTPDGAKLLDFGTARPRPESIAGDTSVTDHALTGPRTIIGTLNYMAPEQLEGKAVDARTDVFAFGAVLYEMVTGRKAFDGQSEASVVAAILEREPQPVTQ